MTLSKHDAEEQTRFIEGRVYDAREDYGQAREAGVPDRMISTAAALIGRQSDLIAALKEQLRQALS